MPPDLREPNAGGLSQAFMKRQAGQQDRARKDDLMHSKMGQETAEARGALPANRTCP